MSAGSGPVSASPARRSARERRLDHLDFLAAEMAAFAGVRIEAAHQDARRARCRTCARRSASRMRSTASSRSAVIAALTSASGRCVVASATRRPPPTSIITGSGAPRVLGQVFGVAGERHARVVDDALVHRRGDHRVEAAGEATVERARRAARARSGHSRDRAGPAWHGARQRHVQHSTRPARQPGRVGSALRRRSQQRRRRPATDRQQHDAAVEAAAEQRRAQVRADAGRFARS